jgi:hypothetical protein
LDSKVLLKNFVLSGVGHLIIQSSLRCSIPDQRLLVHKVNVCIFDLFDLDLGASRIQTGQSLQRSVVMEPKSVSGFRLAIKLLELGFIEHIQMQWTDFFDFHARNVSVEHTRN